MVPVAVTEVAFVIAVFTAEEAVANPLLPAPEAVSDIEYVIEPEEPTVNVEIGIALSTVIAPPDNSTVPDVTRAYIPSNASAVVLTPNWVFKAVNEADEATSFPEIFP